MPRRLRHPHHPTLTLMQQVEALEAWKKKTHGVKSYDWDGERLVVEETSGTSMFNKGTVEAVIFANFK